MKKTETQCEERKKVKNAIEFPDLEWKSELNFPTICNALFGIRWMAITANHSRNLSFFFAHEQKVFDLNKCFSTSSSFTSTSTVTTKLNSKSFLSENDKIFNEPMFDNNYKFLMFLSCLSLPVSEHKMVKSCLEFHSKALPILNKKNVSSNLFWRVCYNHFSACKRMKAKAMPDISFRFPRTFANHRSVCVLISVHFFLLALIARENLLMHKNILNIFHWTFQREGK